MNCLSDHELEALLLRTASKKQFPEWDVHLANCSSCAAALLKKQEELHGDCPTTSQHPDTGVEATLAAPAIGDRGAETASGPPPIDAIAGYKIIKELHRGGQGVVYQALQRSTKRKVALKVMLEGPLAGPESQRRFEREIELIGSLRHPHIVPVFDSGQVEGWFYYAMEYVRGETLQRHVVANKLSVHQTLGLFKRVCDAIDYAHQKGVIHRDLKPSNILVDDSGEPRVLDFGLAKVAGAEAAEDNSLLVSVTGQVMGTLSYMSPEQAAGRPDLVDMRSDVYSLGVILYELLTGQLPYELSGQMAQKLSAIQNVEPPRPSTINRQISDEVETIVMKAMAKEKRRRYYAAGPLGHDVERFLDGDPIEAKRDSALYVMKKLIRRHKAPVVTGVLLLSVVTIALAVSLMFWRQAVQQRDLAETRLGRFTAARNDLQAEADENEQLLQRRRLTGYARDMYVARDAWRAGNIRRMQELLERYKKSQKVDDPRGFMWHYLSALMRQLDSVRTFDLGGSADVAFVDGGKALCVAAGNQVVVVELSSGREQRLTGHTANVVAIASTATGNQLVSADRDGTIHIWDRKAGKPRLVLKHPEQVGALAVSADGKQLATAHSDAGVKLWNVETGDGLHTLSHTKVVSLAFAPTSDLLVTGGRDKVIGVWNLTSGQQVTELRGHTGRVYSLVFSPDGETLYSAGQGNAVKVWDMIHHDRKSEIIMTGGHVPAITLTPDGRTLIVGCRDNTVKLYDVPADAPTSPIRHRMSLKGHTGDVHALALSPDGRQLASGSEDGLVKIWRLAAAEQPTELRETLAGNGGWFNGLAFSHDGTFLVSGGQESPTVWNLGAKTQRVLTSHTGLVTSVAVSPNGKKLVSASAGDNTIKVWDIVTGELLKTFDDHAGTVWTVAFSPDGTLASGGSDRRVGLWNVDSGELIRWHDIGYTVLSVRFSPDGSSLVVAGGEWGRFGTIRILTPSGTDLAELDGHQNIVFNVAFSPDGSTLASAGRDDAVKLWDVRGKREKAHLQGHTVRVTSVSFSPDGKTLASSSMDPIVKLWQVATGEEIGTFVHDENVTCLSFSPDGTTLATLGEGGRITLWRASTEPIAE